MVRQKRWRTLKKEVQREAKDIKKDVRDVETRLTSNSDVISRINAELEDVRHELKENMLDLRCRSIKDNLFFCGIAEVEARRRW